MTNNHRPNAPWWPFLASFVLIAVMCTILFGGLQSLLAYRKSAEPDLPINSATLRFFTKEYFQRRYLRLTTKELPDNSTLPSFHIYAAEKDLASLESDLPSSAKSRFVSGHMKVDTPPFNSEMQFRYRGGLPLHWLYKKKSLRIKLPPFTTFQAARSFNLVNPSTIHTVTDMISYDMARALGLLTPDYYPVRLFINNETNGLHFYLSQVDESLLRKKRRMPGSIYSGDTLYTPNPFGTDKAGATEGAFRGKDGTALLWTDERLWEKDAARNAELAQDRSDIKKFIDIINLDNPLQFMNNFETYFNKDLFYAFWGLDTLVGAYHHDNFHNHKLYFDPYKGKFEPIEWDLRFWSSNFLVKDLPVNPLLRQIILNPILEYQRDKIAYSYLNRFPTEQIIQNIKAANSTIRKELEADPMRQQPDARYGRFEINKEVPYSISEYDEAIAELKTTYLKRHELLQEIYANNSTEYTLTPIDNDSFTLILSINGNSPVDFDPWQLVPKNMAPKVKIIRSHLQTETQLDGLNEERLYPGRVMRKGNALGRADNWAVMAFGREKPEPSPLQYKYIIKGISLEDASNTSSLQAKNAITGMPITPRQVKELPGTEETLSVHPWNLLSQTNPIAEQVTLAGEIQITEDRIYTKQQTVTIEAGTVFKLGKESSLVFYGKVIAKGTRGKPVRFERLDAMHPWGSLVIQGKAASGSHLQHVHVSGGSITTQRLINYPGQINIHDVEQFTLENCQIKNNQIGDDSLHVSYSKGTIRHCLFENSAFDALDIDIAEVNVSDSNFINIGNDAMDLMTSKITVSNVAINGTGDKCFSIGEDSEVSIKHSKLLKCQIGIAVKDQSKAYIEDLFFGEIQDSSIALYRKNPRYGAGGTIDGQRLYGLRKESISIDSASTSLLVDEAFLPLPPSHKESSSTVMGETP